MTKSSKALPRQSATQDNLDRLERLGRGDGPLATAYRRQLKEREEGMVRPTALVTHNSPSRRDPKDVPIGRDPKDIL